MRLSKTRKEEQTGKCVNEAHKTIAWEKMPLAHRSQIAM